jgi:predicted aldo/keto reductase-like oxidoreductase
MRYRILGRTGLEVSEVGFGGIPIIRLSRQDAVSVLRRAYDRGITLYDTANMYVDSEEKMGQAFEGLRHQVVLATKTIKRDRQGAEADIDQSLRSLRTDYIDLYQFHQVSQETDFQTLTGPKGALEGVIRAKEAGKIRHIGITSHSLDLAPSLIQTGLFSTIQFPFNFLEDAPQEKLHPLARQLNLGILCMKPFGGGALDNAQVCFKFLRQWPDVIPLPGFDAVDLVDEVVDIYDSENVVSPNDLAVMEQVRTELGQRFCRRCEYCQPCPQGVKINAAMMYPVIVHRMSPAMAVQFSAEAMETVRDCVECGECSERCPYGLPIPEMLKEHLLMYEEHLAGSKEGQARRSTRV